MKNKRTLKILSLLLAICLLFSAFPLTVFAAYENNHTNTNDALADILAVAATQIGYTEGSGGTTKYGEYFGNSKMDWCCAFISWCADQANISSSVFPKETSCTSMKKAFEEKKLYVNSISQGSEYTPSAGNLVFFSNSSSGGNVVDHIGIVENIKNKTITVIEGNYSNKVARTTYNVSSKKIVGFAIPDYSNARTNYGVGTYLTNALMNFRSSPDTSASVIGRIPFGTYVEVLEVNGEWGYVLYNGQYGWMSLEYSTYVAEQHHEVNWLMVDVSKWQNPSDINWETLKSQGVKAVIIRVGGRGYGSDKTLYADEQFYEHYQRAKAAGLYVGAYFFSYALTKEEAQQEAQLTIDVLNKYNCELDMPVFIDIEDYVESNGNDRQHYKAGKDVCSMVVNTFCDMIETAGYYPGVYCSKAFAEDLLYPYVFENRAVWIAHYGVTQCGYTGQYDMWQYTRYGKLNGYSGYLDLNYCYINFPKFIADNNAVNADYGEHTASQWIVETAASCSSTGKKIIKCTDCGITLKTRVIPCTTHQNTIQGVLWNTTSLLPGAVLNNSQLSAIKTDDTALNDTAVFQSSAQNGTLITYCTDCNKVLSATYSYATSCAHGNVTTATTNATCTKDGLTKTVCSSCKKTVNAQLLHTLSHASTGEPVLVKEATCSQTGENAEHCLECNAVITTTAIDKTSHIYTAWESVSPVSFDEDGECIRYCSECKAVDSRKLNKASLCNVIDDDEKIGANDARLALRFAVHLETPDPREFLAADVNNDGAIKSGDARLILRVAVKLESVKELQEQYF